MKKELPSEARFDWVNRVMSRGLPRLATSLHGLADANLRFHFTTDKFTFKPDYAEDRQVFIHGARQKGWYAEDLEEDGIRVFTWHLLNIRHNGLRSNSCVATLPEGIDAELVRSHPRFFLEAFRKMVIKYGKHALPYKHDLILGINGEISDITGGLVAVSENVPVKPKGNIERTTISGHNFLVATTHYLTQVAKPEDIIASIRFDLNHNVRSQDGKLVTDKQDLIRTIQSGLRYALFDQGAVKGEYFAERYQTGKILQQIFRTRNAELPHEVFLIAKQAWNNWSKVSLKQAIGAVANHPHVGQVSEGIYIGRQSAGNGDQAVDLTAVWSGAVRLAEDPSVRCVVLERNPNRLDLGEASALTIDRVGGDRLKVVFKDGEPQGIDQGSLRLINTVLGNITRVLV